MVPGDTMRAASLLSRYDAISHDLRIRPSAVLRDRLQEAEQQLLALTGADSVDQARDSITAANPTRSKTTLALDTSRQRAPHTPARAATEGPANCVICGRPLPKHLIARHRTIHPSCQPVPCRSCRQPFPPNALTNRRCPACLPKPTPPPPRRRRRKVAGGPPHQEQRALSPLERANRERQEAQRAEAKRLSHLPRHTECAVCGKCGAHRCGKQWRLANGRIVRRARGTGSVWTVRGGLPTLGKRSH